MDIVVTVPKPLWAEWLGEGDLPGEASTALWDFSIGGGRPRITPGERVYVVSHGFVRGYAPLVNVDGLVNGQTVLVRGGGAVACTLLENGKPLGVEGFRGWRYRWWEPMIEGAFTPIDAWMTHGLGDADRHRVGWVLEALAARRQLLPWLEANPGSIGAFAKIGRRPTRKPFRKPLSMIALGSRRMAELLQAHGQREAPVDYMYFSDGLVCVPSVARDPDFISLIHGVSS